MDLAVLEKSDIAIYYQASLSDFTTFQLGGTCPALLACQTPLQLQEAITFCITKNLEYILIGGGSNLVVSDAGVNCHVIRYASETPLIERKDNELIVSGSTALDQLAQYASENGLEGLNYTSGIPGTVGGAIVGNAGAFGRQIGDVIKYVTVIDRGGTEKKLEPKALSFSYRNSILKKTGDIIISAAFSLSKGDRTVLLKERNEILEIRRDKHPDLKKDPCAGSFFRNIEPTSSAGKRQAAGWFLDQADGKVLTAGGARIFPKHANIIIKSNNCSAQDVFELSGKMARLIKNKFDLDLVREVRFVGAFKNQPADVKNMIW